MSVKWVQREKRAVWRKARRERVTARPFGSIRLKQCAASLHVLYCLLLFIIYNYNSTFLLSSACSSVNYSITRY